MAQWTTQLPTKTDAGKWFVMRKLGKVNHDRVQFVEIRWNETFKEVYLCQPCNTGIDKTSAGTPLRDYQAIQLEFFPLAMPADYRN